MADLIERLKQAGEGDHKRGCEGRNYSCSCGYDDLILSAATEAATALSQALARIEELEKALKPFADLGVPSSDKWECGTFLIGHNDIRSAYRAAAKALPTTPIDGGKG